MAMREEIVISGFGGQGTLFAGQLLAYAAMDNDLHVTWYPSYGPEMRGGMARCTVVVADEPIGSPLTEYPTAALVLNMPSMEGFEPLVRPGGTLVVNTSLIPMTSERTDLNIAYVPCTDIAKELGNQRMANVVGLGATIRMMGLLDVKAIEQALEGHLPERHRKLLPQNIEALRRGAELGAAAMAT
jgi:2-oxoglutarate ferredoxin oxidoreductase subunit gamma